MSFNPDNPELIAQLVARRTVVNPTLTSQYVRLELATWPEARNNPRARRYVPPDIWAFIRASLEHEGQGADLQKLEEQIEARLRGVKKLYDAGVRLVIGTNSGSAPGFFQPDANWQEMELFVRAGIPAPVVIGMATRLSAQHLGMGNSVGTIVRDKLADIIIVDGNPLKYMRDLRNVAYVIKDGVQYKPEPGETTSTRMNGK